MTRGNKHLHHYIRKALLKGHSFRWISDQLLKAGYPKHTADGILLEYKHKRNITHMLTFSVLGLMLLTSLYLSGSGISGMSVVKYISGFNERVEIDTTTNSAYTWIPFASGTLQSLRLDGNIIGDGSARIYLKSADKKILVFDSEKEYSTFVDISSGLVENLRHFSSVCDESCHISENEDTYEFIFEISDATLEVRNIHFQVSTPQEIENVPIFSDIEPITMGADKAHTLNLSEYFSGRGNVVYEALSESDLLDVSIDGEIATLSAKHPADVAVYFRALFNDIPFVSNLVEVTILEKTPFSVPAITGNAVNIPKQQLSATPWWVLSFIFITCAGLLFGLQYMPVQSSPEIRSRAITETFDRLSTSFIMSPSTKKYQQMQTIYMQALSQSHPHSKRMYTKLKNHHSLLVNR